MSIVYDWRRPSEMVMGNFLQTVGLSLRPKCNSESLASTASELLNHHASSPSQRPKFQEDSGSSGPAWIRGLSNEKLKLQWILSLVATGLYKCCFNTPNM